MTPRLLQFKDAVKYCGVTPDQFRRLIAAGILPDRIPGTRLFDRKAIDAKLDQISGLATEDGGGPDPS